MADLQKNVILLGDCEEVLKTLPSNYFDAAISDPPYGLGTKEPTARDIELYLEGKSLDTGGDFMGKPWEIPSVGVWKEVFRVLKPGGHVLSFAGTRTWDIMSIGIRAAGFENRDTISSLFSSPCLQWLHGQGFPKSLNISDALRKMADREKDPEKKERLLVASKELEGYGTALKPAWEPILCFRKPIETTSLSLQAAETRTGGMNIDGTRVKHSSPEDFAKHKEHVDRIKSEGGQWGDSWKNSSDLSGANEVTTAGRWPANVVLTHSPGCTKVGTQEVAAPVINRFTDGMKPFGDGAGHPYEQSGGGTEAVAVYECVEGCPVKTLNEQSGRLTTNSGTVTPDMASMGYHGGQGSSRVVAASTGGADRFFAQFMPEAPFFYTGKASKKEKNEGFEKGPAKVSKKKGQRLVVLREKLDEPEMALFVKHWPDDFPDPRTTPLPESLIAEITPEIVSLFTMAKPNDNVHPTVKPVELMRWLVRLVTPAGGIVLDPYCGSGTTCIGALEEDKDFVAIEKDPLYFKIGSKRVEKKLGAVLDNRSASLTASAVYDLPDD